MAAERVDGVGRIFKRNKWREERIRVKSLRPLPGVGEAVKIIG